MSGNRMRAAILNKPLDIEVKEIAIPVPKEDEVLIKVHCIGICGSDVHYYEHGRIGRYVVDKPIILGHELAGTVVEAGSKVTNVKPGDRVAVEPGVTCGRCDYCKAGRYNLCPDVVFMATPPVDGAWAEYAVIRSDFAFKIPETMSFEQGALIEPFSVGIHAMNRGEVKPSDQMLVTGLGPIGLLAIQAAKMYGVTEIYASDVVEYRRQLALDMGATVVFDPSKQDISAELAGKTDGHGADVLIETSGNARAVSAAITSVRRGGRVVLVGMPAQDEIPVNINHLIDAELNVYGLFRYVNTYQAAVQALSTPGLDVEKIITHSFSLEQIKEAVEMARTQKDTSIKIMIYPGEKQ